MQGITFFAEEEGFIEKAVRIFKSTNFEDFSAEVLSSLIILIIIALFSLIIFIVFKKADPLKERPSKFVCVITTLVEMVQNFVISIMGKKWINFSGYAMFLFLYVFMAFTFSLVGLPGPMTHLTVPLSLGLLTFLLIHLTAMRANKLKYFFRYTDPLPPYLPIFVPINLLSMWAPLLSLTFRLFGNAIAGSVLMSIIYYFMAYLSEIIFSFLGALSIKYFVITPVITAILHLYFDIFSGVIQTLVFTMLTMIFISQEDPDESSNEMIANEQ